MKYIVIVASLLMIALMFSLTTQAGTFKDDFNDGNFDGWNIIELGVCGGSEWKVENGMLTAKSNPQGQGLCGASLLFGENEWQNYSIECDAKMVKILSDKAGIGLNLRISVNDGNGIWAWASLVTAAIQSMRFFDVSKLVEEPFDLQVNQWYRLKLVVSKDSIEFYIDGKLMASLFEPSQPFSIGRSVGLFVRNCEAQFDNVVITGDDVPGNSFAVLHQDKLATSWGSIKAIK